MILTKQSILKEIKSGRIKIKPYKKDNVGPASIDLTLSDEIRVFTNKKTIDLSAEPDSKKLSKQLKIKEYTLKPKEFILGMTNEEITLPENMCASLQGRSTYARLGLLVHMTASFIQPGVKNKQVLEIYNASPFPLKLKPGIKVCQLIIQRTEGKAKYKGKYKNQR